MRNNEYKTEAISCHMIACKMKEHRTKRTLHTGFPGHVKCRYNRSGRCCSQVSEDFKCKIWCELCGSPWSNEYVA